MYKSKGRAYISFVMAALMGLEALLFQGTGYALRAAFPVLVATFVVIYIYNKVEFK
jgi:hypothetical protein